MKIVKQGNPNKLKPITEIRFVCEYCGCKYEATMFECTSYHHGSDTYLSYCPCCKELCSEYKGKEWDGEDGDTNG